MNALLTGGDVCAITGIHPTTLDRWVNDDLLNPANKNRGHGRHRVYSVGDAVAVAAGLRYRDEGAGPDRVAGVVKFLSGLGLERLERELGAGRTFPVPGALFGVTWLPGLMIEPPTDEMTPGAAQLLRKLDLAAVVKEVKARVGKLTRPKRSARA